MEEEEDLTGYRKFPTVASSVVEALKADVKEKRKEVEGTERCKQSNLLRCIIGNPFRSVTLDANWLTSTVTQLAETIYEQRAFDRLPILADALEEAGCGSEAILNHFRGPGPHTRGCWALDLLLGKE